MKKTLLMSVLAASVFGMGMSNSVSVFANTTTSTQNLQQNSHQIPFNAENFAKAQQSGEVFLIAFHKKGCSLCTRQQHALEQVYTDPNFKKLRVLVVDYDNDTNSLQQFNVGRQGTLILYKGKQEINRSDALTKANDIERQIQG